SSAASHGSSGSTSAHQPAILFEAATLPLWPSKRHRLALSELLEAPVTVASTLCVLPRVGGST
nr:hypothetical protein [Thermoanaerobaculia bacterium]